MKLADMADARLARLRRRAILVLWAEALTELVLAPLGVVLAYLVMVLFGLGGIITEAAALAGLLLTLGYTVHRFRAPTANEADRRIERASGFAHRPINAFEDRVVPSRGPLAIGLWNAHQARLARQLAGARTGFPHWHLAERDPLGLRAALALGLIVAAIIAGPELPARMADFIILPRWQSAPGAELASWLTPPPWSGEAPRLIGASHDIAALPGSHLALIVTGAGRSAPSAAAEGHKVAWTALGGGSFRADLVLRHDGAITAGPFWDRLAAYRVSITPLIAPTIGFAGQPGPNQDGKRTDIPYQAKDRYGLTAIRLSIRPSARQAKPETVSIPLQAAAPHRQSDRARLDLLASPYAGMAVGARLEAHDVAGLDAKSAEAAMILPAPKFTNASARAIEALRQQMALDPESHAQVAAALGDVAAAPPGPLTASTDLQLAAFASALGDDLPSAAHPITQLWTFVQMAEQGQAYRTAQALARARAALDHALSKMLATHHADAGKLDRLLHKFDQALAAHLAALRSQNPAQNSASPEAKPLDPAALHRLAETIARETRQGDQAAAQRDIQKLEQMLRQLQSAQPMSAAQQARAQAAANAAAKAGASLSKLMQGEAQLLDQTATAQQGMNPSQSLAAGQNRLQQALQQLRQALAHAGLMHLPGLGESGKAMGKAAQHLQQGDQPGAMPSERAAIGALQQAAGALARMGQTSPNQGSPSGSTAEGAAGLGQLGQGNTGQSGADREGRINLKPGQRESPAQMIERELINRDANPALPSSAHDYYRRLLGHQY